MALEYYDLLFLQFYKLQCGCLSWWLYIVNNGSYLYEVKIAHEDQ